MKDTADFDERIGKLIEASIATKRAMLGDSQIVSTLAKVCELLINALSQGNKILLFGNGGSAADAQHLAAERAAQDMGIAGATSADPSSLLQSSWAGPH